MTTEVHDAGLILAALIVASVLLGLLLRAFHAKHVALARLAASLFANVAVAIFTGREAFRAFARGGVFFIGLGVVLALLALSAAALAAVFTWALARDRGELRGDQPTA